MGVAERIGLFGDVETLREIVFGAFVLRLEIGKELDAELHDIPVSRHPEVAAEPSSKGDGLSASAVSFEARSARTPG